MAVATKTALSPAPPPSIAGSVAHSAPAPKPLKLVAASPNHDRVNRNGNVKKAKSQNPKADLSPRLELSLDVQCDTVGEQKAEIERWLSAMR